MLVGEGGTIMAAAAAAGFGETVCLLVPRMLAVSPHVPHPKLASLGGVCFGKHTCFYDGDTPRSMRLMGSCNFPS